MFSSHLAGDDSILDLLPLTAVDRLEHVHAAPEQIHCRRHQSRLADYSTTTLAVRSSPVASKIAAVGAARVDASSVAYSSSRSSSTYS